MFVPLNSQQREILTSLSCQRHNVLLNYCDFQHFFCDWVICTSLQNQKQQTSAGFKHCVEVTGIGRLNILSWLGTFHYTKYGIVLINISFVCEGETTEAAAHSSGGSEVHRSQLFQYAAVVYVAVCTEIIMPTKLTFTQEMRWDISVKNIHKVST